MDTVCNLCGLVEIREVDTLQVLQVRHSHPTLPTSFQSSAAQSPERQNKALADEWLQTAIDYKVEWEQELQRREALGITDLPDPIPLPDQVIIDMNTGMARVQGPMTKEDLAQLEHWTKCRDDWAEEVSALTEHLSSEPDEGIRKIVQADLKHARKMLETIEMALEKIGY